MACPYYAGNATLFTLASSFSPVRSLHTAPADDCAQHIQAETFGLFDLICGGMANSSLATTTSTNTDRRWRRRVAGLHRFQTLFPRDTRNAAGFGNSGKVGVV